MKVDFKARFSDVERRINTPVEKDARSQGPQEFQTLLMHLSPDKPQLIENTKSVQKKEAPVPKSKELQEDAMARFQFDAPELELADTMPIAHDSVGIRFDNEVPVDVKSPTLLEAKRTPHVDEFASLSLAEREKRVAPLISDSASKAGIDPSLALAVAHVESALNPNAISKDGFASKGLFQLLDSTGKQQLDRVSGGKAYDPFNPEQNSVLGVSYLRYLHEIFSSDTSLPNGANTVAAANSTSLENLAVAAYNAGEGRVASAQARARAQGLDPSEYSSIEPYLPESTQQYVRRVGQVKPDYFDFPGSNSG
ncbi:MAG: transglycosylase SLT domain-containing protein [Bdellovibrionales bacterium]|nr:transglycosylase SLT domain-containing protein [Bdellovibrionales bacterium]